MLGGGHRSNEFEVRIDSANGTLTVSVAGELDIGTVDIALGWIDGHPLDGETEVVLELGALSFVDAAGLQALLDARDRLSQQVPTVKFVNVSPAVDRVTQVLGVDLNSHIHR